MNTPAVVGVPLMVIVLDDQAALTPEGKPVAVPMPVAPVVVWVILVKAVFIYKVGEADAAPAVLIAVTVTTAEPLFPVPAMLLASVTETMVYVVVAVGLTDILAPDV